jgi:hypothetical protein
MMGAATLNKGLKHLTQMVFGVKFKELLYHLGLGDHLQGVTL